MKYDKPFVSIEDQIELLKEKRVCFEDRRLKFIRICLQNHSYYAIINGFKDLYDVSYDETKKLEVFKDKVPFDDLYTLFTIDSSLNNILFKYIIHVERSLKTKISHTIASQFGIAEPDYLDSRKYRNTKNLNKNLEIGNICNQIRRPDKCASIDHYREKHNHVPPWIAVNGLMFGTVINWYKILKSEPKRIIADSYFCMAKPISIDDKLNILPSMLTLLQTYRNNIAHGNRTFQSVVKSELPKKELLEMMPTELLTEAEFKRGLGKKDLYAVILSLLALIDDPFILLNLSQDLKTILIPFLVQNIQISGKGNILDTLNLPRNIFNRIEFIAKNKAKLLGIDLPGDII
mgnify:CR=1 FL=1